MTQQKLNLCTLPVVLPAEPTAVEHSAALEFCEHLEKMCGVTPLVILESEIESGEKAVYIGATEFAKGSGITHPESRFGEGWAIRATEGSLILTGSKRRGSLYAVYHLLEDVFGVRWWTVWEESIPSYTEAVVPQDYDHSGIPAMEYRDIFAWPVETDSRFAVRNRLNGWAMPISTDFGGMETFGQPAHVHTFDRYFPEKGDNPGDVRSDWAIASNPENESYFETHPEWFAFTRRGKRVPKVLCMSNEGLRKAFLGKLLKAIEFSYAQADREGKARPRFFNLSPADMIGECNCDACAESIRRHGSSGHQIRFVNDMAAEVKKVYPEAMVETISYWHYLVPPKDDTAVSPDVMLRYCNNKMDILHDIHHPNNRQYLEGLQKWLSLCGKGNLYLWDYGVLYNPNGIVPSMYKFGENFRTFTRLGVNGYFLEMEHPITTDMWDMKAWLAAKLMEDPSQDQNQLMDDFIAGYYGAAGPFVRQYLDAAHERVEQYGASYDYCNASLIYAAGFTVSDMLFYDDCFQKALAAVKDDPVFTRRVGHARLCLDRVIIENYEKWQEEAKSLGLCLPDEKEAIGRRIYETISQQIEFRGQWDPNAPGVMKLYEKYLPDYDAPAPDPELEREARLVKVHGSKDAWKGASPVIVSKEELQNVPREKCYVFTADPDFGERLQEDPDSDVGAAATYDLPALWRNRVICQDLLLSKWQMLDGDDEKCLPIGVYTGKLDPNGWPISAIWGTIRASDICADGKYHLYKFPDIVAVAEKNGSLLHMFREWALALFSFSAELGHLAGKTVDCYISMKVSGDISCTDLENLPVYRIDQVIVAEK